MRPPQQFQMSANSSGLDGYITPSELQTQTMMSWMQGTDETNDAAQSIKVPSEDHVGQIKIDDSQSFEALTSPYMDAAVAQNIETDLSSPQTADNVNEKDTNQMNQSYETNANIDQHNGSDIGQEHIETQQNI